MSPLLVKLEFLFGFRKICSKKITTAKINFQKYSIEAYQRTLAQNINLPLYAFRISFLATSIEEFAEVGQNLP